MARKTSLKLGYSPPFTTLLVFSTQKGYRLAWLMNNHLGFELKRLATFEFTLPESPPSFHELYGFYHTGLRMNVLLMANRSTSGKAIIGEKPVADFILFFWNIPENFDLKGLLRKTRKINELQAITPLGEKFAGKYHGFFYDLELFLHSLPLE